MFEILANIIELQTSKLREIPTKLDKEKLQEYYMIENPIKIIILLKIFST